MKDELQGIIGKNLRKYRKSQGMTREEVAEKVGISLTFYANLESGNRIMSVPTLRRIADVLCVSTDALLYDEEKSSQVKNIDLLLKEQPQKTVTLAEKVVRILVNELNAETGEIGQ